MVCIYDYRLEAHLLIWLFSNSELHGTPTLETGNTQAYQRNTQTRRDAAKLGFETNIKCDQKSRYISIPPRGHHMYHQLSCMLIHSCCPSEAKQPSIQSSILSSNILQKTTLKTKTLKNARFISIDPHFPFIFLLIFFPFYHLTTF